MRGTYPLPESIYGDRRSRQRFPVNLPVEFSALSQVGSGRVLDISHDGIAFTGRLPVGECFTAVVSLPVERNARPVELVLHCEVVRQEPGRTAAKIYTRRFTSAGYRPEKAMAAGGSMR
jgi:hypothetical protein